VGVEQSDELVAALRDVRATVEYERREDEGVDHAFDTDKGETMYRMYSFLGHFL